MAMAATSSFAVAVSATPVSVLGVSQPHFCMRAGHFVLQMEARHGRARAELAATDALHVPDAADALGPPLFRLVGLAVGNGLTDPPTQVTRVGCRVLGPQPR